jgi:putative ABC transport system permease protein
MLFKLAWKNIWHKPLNAILSVMLLSASVAIIAIVMLVQKQFEDQFTKQLDGVDLILGAQGSPLQLVLSSLYHMDSPTGNISMTEANKYLKHPHVKQAIPLAFGDNFAGYKIVGTTEDFIKKYDAKIASGSFFSNNFEVVIGHQVALNKQLKIGSTFYGTHGEGDEGHVHEEQTYKVVGILAPSETALDFLVLCNVAGVWKIHNHEEVKHDSIGEITAALLKMKNKMSILTWQRQVSADSKLQAVSPAIEINRLFSLFGIGIEGLKYLAFGLMFISAISIFIALYNALKARKYEFALMRISGASQFQLLCSLLLESLFLGLVGFVLGLVLSRIGLYLLSLKTQSDFKLALNVWQFSFENEGILLIFTLFIAIFAALIPAFKTYQISIAKTISHA